MELQFEVCVGSQRTACNGVFLEREPAFVCFCGHGYELSSSTKDREFLDYLNDSKLGKNNSVRGIGIFLGK
jgi:hypothetical protein